MATVAQDRDFLRDTIPEDLLSQAQEFIANNMRPEDVFSGSQLDDWATENGYTSVDL